MWKEGTELMIELAVHSERRRSSSAFVDTNIYLNHKRCERQSRVILTNILTEFIGLDVTAVER